MLVVLKTLSEPIPRTYLGAGPTGPVNLIVNITAPHSHARLPSLSNYA